MVALPLMALAYSMGGVTVEQIVAGVVSIFSLSILTGSFCVLQSVRSASAVGALASTLIWMFVFSMFLGGFLFFGMLGSTLVGAALTSAIVLTLAFLFLQSAARRLPRAAIDPPRSRLLIAFRRVDVFFHDLNKGFGNIELTRDRVTLPGDEPLYWRERCKRALGRTHHLMRIVALLEIPTVLAVVLMVTAGSPRFRNPLGGFVDFLWIVAVLIVAIRTVGVWPLERSRGTLDVLLTTPLSGRELVDQAMRGVRRTMIAVAVPIATVQLATFFVQPPGPGRWYYLMGSALALVSVLPLAAWASMLIGLRMRSQLRATLAVGVLLFVSITVPSGLFPINYSRGHVDWLPVRAAIDPALLISMPQSVLTTDAVEPGGAFTVAFILSALCAWQRFGTWLLRRSCLRNVSKWLGRDERVARASASGADSGKSSTAEEFAV